MEFIRWDEKKYSVGVVEIDEQHKRLIELANNFVGNFGKASHDEIQSTLDEMIEYTIYHFKTEEETYLVQHPNFELHKQEHQLFIDKTTALQSDLVQNKEGLSAAILNFLLVWLKNHILGTDKQFFADLGLAKDT